MSGFPKHQTGVQKKGSPVKLISGQGPQTSGEAQTTTISTASGAMQGAQAGAMFGPWGMAAGAIVGGADIILDFETMSPSELKLIDVDSLTTDQRKALAKRLGI